MKKVTFLFLFHFIYFGVFAQQSVPKVPALLKNNKFKNIGNINNYDIKGILKRYKDDDKLKNNKNIYGISQLVNINFISQSTSVLENDSLHSFLIRFSTDANYGLQFIFDEFYLPDNVNLYIYNEEKTKILFGAFTNRNNNDKNKFVIRPIYGKNIIMELDVRNKMDLEKIKLHISKIVYVFKPPFKQIKQKRGDECYINTSCPTIGLENTMDWTNEIKSVAMVLLPMDDYYYASHTIFFINKSGGYGNFEKPYFLTAAHSIGSCSHPERVNEWIFALNYESFNCTNASIQMNNEVSADVYENDFIYDYNITTLYGANCLACKLDQDNDFLLGKLTTISANTLKSFYGVCFAGWDINDASTNFSLAIGHPDGYSKKMALTYHPLNSVGFGGTLNPNGSYWKIFWDYGKLYDCASGSPLFNDNHKVIGIYVSGYSDCFQNINGPDYCVKLSKSFASGHFSQWLGTANCVESSCSNSNNEDSNSGGWYYPNLCYSSDDADNMMINDNFSFHEITCAQNLFLKPICNNPDCDYCWWKFSVIKNDYRWSDNFPSYITNKNLCYIHYPTFDLWAKHYKCAYRKNKLTVYETDINKNVISSGYSKWIYLQLDNSIGYYNDMYHSSSYADVLNIPSSLLESTGITLKNGHYYKIVASDFIQNGNKSFTSYFRYIPENLSISNQSINTDLSACNDIIIDNSTINNGAVISAGNSITMTNSTMENGTLQFERPHCVCSNNNPILYSTSSDSLNDNSYESVKHPCSCNNKNNEALNQITDSIQIYPNPATDIITINSYNEMDKVIIMDVIGNINYQNTIHKKVVTIDISKLNSGIYVIKIIRNNIITTKSLTKI